jgi:outer membrane translocation and assembly module TamA
VALEAAGGATGSSYGFARGLAEATGTRTLGRTAELAARVRLGAVTGDDVLPPQLRLYSGGAGTVRGVEQNLVGPKVLVAGGDTLAGALCAPADRTCDDIDAIDPDVVTVRPTGGDRVIEGNLEGRLWLTDSFQLAAFLDYGSVTRTTGSAAALGPRSEARLTPGIGLRLIADIGPIRVDLGYDPAGARVYPVLAADADGGVAHIGNARFDPYNRGAPGFWRELGRRLQLHMAIGQAFQ